MALGLEPLFAEREEGEAVTQSHPTGGYWLVHRPEEQGNRALRGFKQWMLAELAKDS